MSIIALLLREICVSCLGRVHLLFKDASSNISFLQKVHVSPVNLTTHPQLDFQTLEPLRLREALGIFCHYFPVIVFVVLSVKYNKFFLTLLDTDSEILLEFNLLISAQ